MAVEWIHWRQHEPHLSDFEYNSVAAIARALHEELLRPEVQVEIDAVNRPGMSSGAVQAVILEHAGSLGFQSEKTGLFADFHTPGLRPDYYRALPQSAGGIILEVERGKTTINNMDLLDFWKAHICTEASHLFLLVPRVLQQNAAVAKTTKPFEYVKKRLPAFFSETTYTSVKSCWLFGY
jgi:hypothetical protein